MDLRKGFHEPQDKPRRFYRTVSVCVLEGGWGVELDGRRLRTPQAMPLVLPVRALAEQVAEEWAAQSVVIELATMHATRLANTAIESIAGVREAIADQIADYAASDLLCYFAAAPQALVERQRLGWEPVLQRIEHEEGVQFQRAVGIVHRPQPDITLTRIRDISLQLNDFQLAGLAFGVSLFGSAILGVALFRGWLTPDMAFELSRLDEAFQESLWGVDADAAERTARLGREARVLEQWFRALET